MASAVVATMIRSGPIRRVSSFRQMSMMVNKRCLSSSSVDSSPDSTCAASTKYTILDYSPEKSWMRQNDIPKTKVCDTDGNNTHGCLKEITEDEATQSDVTESDSKKDDADSDNDNDSDNDKDNTDSDTSDYYSSDSDSDSEDADASDVDNTQILEPKVDMQTQTSEPKVDSQTKSLTNTIVPDECRFVAPWPTGSKPDASMISRWMDFKPMFNWSRTESYKFCDGCFVDDNVGMYVKILVPELQKEHIKDVHVEQTLVKHCEAPDESRTLRMTTRVRVLHKGLYPVEKDYSTPFYVKPENYEFSHVWARVENGVLKIFIPKLQPPVIKDDIFQVKLD